MFIARAVAESTGVVLVPSLAHPH